MKMINILLVLAIIGTLSFAQNPSVIDVQIQAIQEAPAAQRVELMNQFKIQLSNMNAEDRTAAIGQMQTKMQTQTHAHSDSNNNMLQVRDQEHAIQMQMNENDDMSKIQNMSQQQAGSQFGHEAQSSGGFSDMDTRQPIGTPPSEEGMFGERH
ncbi:hypothetical protein JHD49_04430 [Sulfurimonas sp. SAG-AH-194-C21]|nr:hypothetical protein [Sulfurimonas sp. SAG-AH-194-C21]MDF1883178.1 hypothetical protein [Sulfurimonas sp. SAG-AH-194-C21]